MVPLAGVSVEEGQTKTALVNREFANENSKLLPLMVPGLFMKRPIQIPASKDKTAAADPHRPYPDFEEKLPKIEKTLAALIALANLSNPRGAGRTERTG